MKNSQDSTVLEIVTADLEGLSTCGKFQWAGSANGQEVLRFALREGVCCEATVQASRRLISCTSGLPVF